MPQNTFEFLFTDQDKAVVVTYESMRYFEGGRLIDTFEPKEKVELMDSMYVELAKALSAPGTAPYITTFAQAESIMKVVDACYRSAVSGQVVKLTS